MDKRGVKIMKDGKVADISELRANDHLTATIITSHPPKVMTEKQVQATLARSPGGSMASGAGAPAAAAAPARSSSAPSTAATSGASGDAPKKLPKTATQLPLVALAGLASLAAALGLNARRRRATR
jgi:LPXTG-motif cell wall-anchored protein